MAIFEGSIQEFHHYIGPRIRNVINIFASKDRKARDGVCEGYEGKDCGKIDQILESAHIHGRGRRAIIEKILSRYSDKGIVRCDLESVEKEILEEHGTIADVFKFLCKQCHAEYDNLAQSEKASSTRRIFHTVPVCSSNGGSFSQSLSPVPINLNRLELKFFPDDEAIFKALLIKSQKSYVLIRKADGTFEPVKEWSAGRFKETSNLRGNIFSGYLRNWRQKGIVEASFAIRESDLYLIIKTVRPRKVYYDPAAVVDAQYLRGAQRAAPSRTLFL